MIKKEKKGNEMRTDLETIEKNYVNIGHVRVRSTMRGESRESRKRDLNHREKLRDKRERKRK